MKIPDKRELQQTALNHSSDISQLQHNIKSGGPKNS